MGGEGCLRGLAAKHLCCESFWTQHSQPQDAAYVLEKWLREECCDQKVSVVLAAGIEPATCRLQGGCSTI